MSKKKIWGPHVLCGVDFTCKYQYAIVPSPPKLDGSFKLHNYAFVAERRAVDMYANAKLDETPQAMSHIEVADKLPRTNGTFPHFDVSFEPLQPLPVNGLHSSTGLQQAAVEKHVDLRDFEKSDDPFDNAELNSIDVLAELSHVLSSGNMTRIKENEVHLNDASVKSVKEIHFPCLSQNDADQDSDVVKVEPGFLPPSDCAIKISGMDENCSSTFVQSSVTSSSVVETLSDKASTEKNVANGEVSWTSTELQLVQSLTKMGFEQSRCTSALRMIGNDKRKVIDFLCSVDELVELNENVSISEAQDALELFRFSFDLANKFLILKRDLKEFGFSETDILQAVKARGLDRSSVVKWLEDCA